MEPPQPSQQPAFLGIPSHVAIRSLGFGVMLDLGIYPKGALPLIEIEQLMGLIQSQWQV